MATIRLPRDFKEFLQLLNSHRVKYLLVGGYAVGLHGHPRATGDMDIWVAAEVENADRLVAALKEFGFAVPQLSRDLFLREKQIVQMGLPPMRIEILTTISGVTFAECYAERRIEALDDVEASIISYRHLKINKRASGRPKDLADLAELE